MFREVPTLPKKCINENLFIIVDSFVDEAMHVADCTNSLKLISKKLK